MAKILAVNTGSSTLKWKLFQMPEESVIAGGMVDRLGLPGSKVKIKYGDNQVFNLDCEIKTADEAVELLLDKLLELNIINSYEEISGVGHRVVAGGEVFKKSAVIDKKGLRQIMDLAELAPLHNPAEARGIAAFMHALPNVPEVGVFDTSFHTSLPPMNYLYSIPTEYYKQFGLRKYGAHGTSVRFVAERSAEILNEPLAELRMVVLHMGSGVSVTAVKDGASFDTSMGYTPVSGVTMSTRSGDIDPSLVAMLMKKLNITDPDAVISLLNNKSGVKGLSGLSPDMREIEATINTRPESKLAIDIFVNRIVKYVAGYIAEMGGVEAIVFTAGIGEADAAMRERITKGLAVFGLTVDTELNQNVKGEADITGAGSAAKILVVPTNEELMIARDVVTVGECL